MRSGRLFHSAPLKPLSKPRSRVDADDGVKKVGGGMIPGLAQASYVVGNRFNFFVV